MKIKFQELIPMWINKDHLSHKLGSIPENWSLLIRIDQHRGLIQHVLCFNCIWVATWTWRHGGNQIITSMGITSSYLEKSLWSHVTLRCVATGWHGGDTSMHTCIGMTTDGVILTASLWSQRVWRRQGMIVTSLVSVEVILPLVF